MSTIHRIADRAPEFPCWLWNPNRTPLTDKLIGWERWKICTPDESYYLKYRTHWSPDAPTAPTERPDDITSPVSRDDSGPTDEQVAAKHAPSAPSPANDAAAPCVEMLAAEAAEKIKWAFISINEARELRCRQIIEATFRAAYAPLVYERDQLRMADNAKRNAIRVLLSESDGLRAERDALKAELEAERNLHGQTRVVVEELNIICDDLKNAGQPQFVRSEAIRILRDEQCALKAQLAARTAEAERYRAHLREKIYVDATPDENLPARILSAHIDESTITGGVLAEQMNVWQQERNAILRQAIAQLKSSTPNQP